MIHFYNMKNRVNGGFLRKNVLSPSAKRHSSQKSRGREGEETLFTAERLFVWLLQLVDEHPIRNKCINGQLSTTGVRLQ